MALPLPETDTVDDFAQMLLMTAAAGACIPVGGLLAKVDRFLPRWVEREFRHSIIAFGGGVLVAAVALVLVPEGMRKVDTPWLSTAFFLAGGALFAATEAWLARRGGAHPQLMAMLLDYLPESLALGSLFVSGSPAAPLLAVLIGLQNLPEGFNAAREMGQREGNRARHNLWLMSALIPLGPLFGILGWAHGGEHPVFIGGVMLFAAGGILYLLFQDIAPQSRLERHWGPTLGAVLGFGLGMLGDGLIHGIAA
jgi:ZIP family zinc transporter